MKLIENACNARIDIYLWYEYYWFYKTSLCSKHSFTKTI